MKNVTYFFGWLAMALAVIAVGPDRVTAQDTLVIDNKTAGAVNHLIERYIDGEKGYREAAEHVRDTNLRDTFTKKSDQRKKFREELQNKLSALGKDIEKGGSAEAAAHRAWIDAKSLVTKGDDVAILNAARTGEESAFKSYKELLGSPLPEDLKNTIQSQYTEVLESYNWVIDEIKDRTNEDTKEFVEAKEEVKQDARNTFNTPKN